MCFASFTHYTLANLALLLYSGGEVTRPSAVVALSSQRHRSQRSAVRLTRAPMPCSWQCNVGSDRGGFQVNPFPAE